MSFAHLHVHSHYSLLDGLGSPKAIVKKAKEMGCPAVALTDHGNMYGAIEFYKAAKEQQIKGIIGTEAYVAPTDRFDRTPGPENKPFHLILLAKNNEGYENLMYLSSKASLEGFYYKPRIDFGLLKAHSKGLIASSACLAGEVSKAILNGDEAKQLAVINKYVEIFGKENYFLELQDHPLIDEQKIVNDRIIELAKKTGIRLIATNDSHYISKDDVAAHDIQLCIQTQTTIDDENRMRYGGDFSLRTPDDMANTFSNVPDAIKNTLEIADMVDFKLELGKNLLPKFHCPNGIDSAVYLRQLCEEGLMKYYKGNPPEAAWKQLNYELDVIGTMGFNDYFLIVWDFVKYAKDTGIAVGPGRGSAAGSLVTFSLNITELNPLEHGLIFERFLNPERVSMPDVDIDFADDRREDILAYVRRRWGDDCVAQIITFGTMAARAAVRDVGRAMGYPYSEVDIIAKLVPQPVLGKHIPLKESIENDPELKKIYHADPRAKTLLDNAIKLEGTVRHAGTHASAVVITGEPLVKHTPVQRPTGDGAGMVTQYSMKPVEEIGILKMDFLGLKNLTIMQRALEIIERTKGIKIDLSNIPIDDAEAFKVLQEGDTTGVFQLESAGMRKYIIELKPTAFSDIVAMISLYRPGPMDWIPMYIKGKHDPSTVKYLHPSFEPLFKETNGVAIYQEQIMSLARLFSGFSMGQADILRKAVGKKIPALLAESKNKFIDGAVNLGHDAKFAQEVFEKVVEPFAGYGFNKAHAACYAMISYRTAYLKAHYKTEFMAALMSCDAGNTEKIVEQMTECEEKNIKVLQPSVNDSFHNFTVVEDNVIRFGLNAIKGLGEATIEAVIKAREQGDRFKSIEDFLLRVPVPALNKKSIEAMAYGGAFDDLAERKAIIEGFEEMIKFAKQAQNEAAQGQTSIFGAFGDDADTTQSFKLKHVQPASLMQRLNWEKEYLGLYVSGHPLKGLKKYLSKKVNLIEKLTKKNVGKPVKLAGLITSLRKILTKSGQYMAYGEIEDPTGRMEFVVFTKVFNLQQHLLKEGAILMLDGKLEMRGPNCQFSVWEAKELSIDSMVANAKASGTYDENEKVNRAPIKIDITGEKKEVKKIDASDMLYVAAPPSTDDDWKEEPYIIRIKGGMDSAKLAALKLLLTEHPGSRKVEVHIDINGIVNKIQLPFTIFVDSDIETEINRITS